jgi:dienelactone hydrolase
MGVYKPAGAGPFPGVVLHHTCAGIHDHIGDWTRVLLQAGYAVLVVDSLTQRRVSNNCRPPLAIPTANGVLDAHHALEHLARQPYVDRDRIGFIGLSWGAMIGLLSAQKDFTDRLPRPSKEPRFSAIVAVYPHCVIPAGTIRGLGEIRYLGERADSPLLVLMGGDDVETPPKYCLPGLEAMKAKGMKVEWEVYPGAGHGWDLRWASGKTGHSFFVGSYTYQYRERTSAEARKRALEFLSREMPAGRPAAKAGG